MLQDAWAEQGSEPDAMPSLPLSYYCCAFRYCPLVAVIWTKKRNQKKGASPTRALPLFLRRKNVPASPGLAGASAMLAAAAGSPGDLKAAAGSLTPWPGEGGPGRGWVCFCGPGGASGSCGEIPASPSQLSAVHTPQKQMSSQLKLIRFWRKRK